MSEMEYVELKIKVPKQVTVFVENFAKLVNYTVEEFWKNEIQSIVASVLDSISGCYLDDLAETYKLEEYLKDC